MTSDLLLYIPLGLLAWILMGAAVLAALDFPDRRFYRWYAAAPAAGITCSVILVFWPVLAAFMVRARLGS